ncbi:MAG: prepilin peptidase [Candidatus Paceibacterota bacterium]|jgi:leader peptidase (prepilin peptidase)/N-methyltransferase
MEITYTLFAFIFGTIIGSFLNVVVFRMNTNMTLGGRSMCLSCAKPLRWFELIPLVSYFIQRGKCRRCLSKISSQYSWVEFFTGIVFAFIFLKFQYMLIFGALLPFIIVAGFYLLISSILIVTAVYDLRHKIIPDSCAYSFIGLSMLAPFFIHTSGCYLEIPLPLDLLAGFIISLPFGLIWLLSNGRLMGFGDVKLMVGIGFLLGLSSGITAVVFAFWIGAAASLLLLIFKGREYTMKSEIPFAPFLILATLLVFFYNWDIGTLLGIFQFN